MANPWSPMPAGNVDLHYPNSRIMSSVPHVDGLGFAGAAALAKDSANLVLTRNSIGYWSLNRTAGGAETFNVRAVFGDMGLFPRTGEKYVLGELVDNTAAASAAPAKGIEIVDIFAVYQVGVVNLTSMTLRLGKTLFANNAAPVQTDILAATTTGKLTAAGDATGPYVATLAVAAPVFSVDDLALVEIETVIVMANTGTIKLVGLGCHFNFNYA